MPTELPPARRLAALALISLVAVALTGCDGDQAWKKAYENPDSGDQVPAPDIPRPRPPGGGSGDGDDAFFDATFVAAYQDQFPAGENQRQYAVRVVLEEDGNDLTGQGTMWRVYRTGALAAERIPLEVRGSIQTGGLEADMILRFNEETESRWQLRRVDGGMTGYYRFRGGSGEFTRYGHARWYRTLSQDVEGTWAAAMADAWGDEDAGFPQRARTGVAVITPGDPVTGSGLLTERVETAPAPAELAFTITGGAFALNRLTLTFGDGDLGANEYDWYGFVARPYWVGAYGQFTPDGADDVLVRTGHATWRLAPDPVPSDVNGTWVAAFNDMALEDLEPGQDYLAEVELRAGGGGAVTGSASLLREEGEESAYRAYTLSNGNLLGTRLTFDLTRGSTRFVWDLRLANAALAGTYQRLDADGDVVGTGTAVFRPRTRVSLEDRTWAAAWADTFGELSVPVSQLALVNITSQSGSELAGDGSLRYATENTRRVLSVRGDLSGRRLSWLWTSPDAFGRTVWHLQQAGDYLVGTYTNFTAEGEVEFRGNAVFTESRLTENL